MEESAATHAQQCKFCDEPASCSVILWGGNFIPVCRPHEGYARDMVRRDGGSVVDVKMIEPGLPPYGEARLVPMTHPAARLDAALQPALAFVDPEEPGTRFGLQAGPERLHSAFQEAPAEPPPRAPIGRRGTPRGAVVRTHTGKDMMGVTGKPIARTTGRRRRPQGTSGPARVVTKRDRTRQEIPDSLLQMLGTDWKTMRAHRVHDNRMTISIDGVRYTLYTRRG